MKNFTLLAEVTEKVEFLTESVEGKKRIFIEGIFAQSEIKNGNGRFYSRDIMEQAVEKFNNEYVSKKRAYGEINHPTRPFVDIDQVAIKIVEYKMMGNDVYGKALVLNTPKGQTIAGLVEGDCGIGVSTRGLGSLVERAGVKHVQKDFFKTAVDVVDNPSAPNALVRGINEGVRWTLNESSGIWVPIVDENENEKVNEQLFLEKLEETVKKFKNKRFI